MSAVTRRTSRAAAAVLSMAALTVPATVAHAAGESISVPSDAAAGSSFSVSLTGLTKGSAYRVVLTSGASITDTTNVAESDSCSTATAAADVTATCTFTEATAGTYDVKLIDGNNTVIAQKAVTVNKSATVPAPIVTDRAGGTDDRLTLEYTPGVVWSFVSATGGTVTKAADGSAVTSSTQIFDPATTKAGDKVDLQIVTPSGTAATDVTVKADSASGYAFPTQQYTLRVTSAATVPAPLVITSAQQPTVIDQPGLDKDAVTLQAVEGVDWYVGDSSSPVTFAAGETTRTFQVTPDPVTKKVTVRAVARAGYTFEGGRVEQSFPLQYTDAKGEPTLTRIAGNTRFDTAVAIAQKYFPGEEKTVYVANGMSFPDALAAGPAAAAEDAPLLLTARTSIQSNVLDEIRRMKPTTIKVIGGSDVVSSSVADELGKIATVTRIQGDDRFATAAAVSKSRAKTGGTVYIASGLNFPDALAGGSGAAREDASMLLTDGSKLSDDTVIELRRLKPTKVVLMGGTDVVRATVARQASDVLGTGTEIVRAAGATRFETSALIIENVTGKPVMVDNAPVAPTTVFFATGLNFPDALAGIPAAHVANAPLALVRPTCQPVAVKAQLDKLSLTETVRLGSANVVGDFKTLTPGC